MLLCQEAYSRPITPFVAAIPLHSKSKLHKRRVQQHRHTKRRAHEHPQREDRCKSLDAPLPREEVVRADHHSRHDDAEDKGASEAAQDLGHLLEEVYLLGLLGCGTPLDVDLEEVAEEGLGHVEA